MDDKFMVVRCRGCRRSLGIGTSNPRVYCDVACYEDYPAVAEEGRDALIEAIYNDHATVSRPTLAKMFDLSRQRIDQILRARTIGV